MQFARMLSNTKGSVNEFVKGWEEVKWHSDWTKVDDGIAQKMSAMKAVDDRPEGNSPAAILKRTAYRLVAFVREVQSETGRPQHD